MDQTHSYHGKLIASFFNREVVIGMFLCGEVSKGLKQIRKKKQTLRIQQDKKSINRTNFIAQL